MRTSPVRAFAGRSIGRRPLNGRTNVPILVSDPPWSRALFASTRWSWVWLLPRLYVGYVWLTAGFAKLGQAAWMQDGSALRGFWERAIQVPPPPAKAPIAFDWYRSFLAALLEGGHYTWFAKVIVFTELIVGTALILGAFTGIAAFTGGFLSWNFMMAGTASTNPVLFTLSILLMLGWKTSGWWGLDRWLLPALGTPWDPSPAAGPGVSPGPSRAGNPVA